MADPPEGYLGAGGPIGRGPAPELVEAGYELELADAPLLARGLGLADLAHVLTLEAIPDGDRAALLGALVELLGEEVEVDARYGDLANVRELALERRVGTAAGWLNAGRPRREAGRIAFRIALRVRVLDLAAATARFAAALTEAAARERDTPMPDYTYLRAAQPTTAGHWLLSFAYPALRDFERLRGDYAWVNRSPAGAGGVNGSRFAPDRGRLAERLGFSEPIEHTRDAGWQTDGLADLTSHAAIAATGASRFAEDVELYGSEEFGLLRIGDELCRASALMPQKRNPYALVVLRGGAGTLIGRATGVLATQRTPSGRTDNLLYAYGEVAGAVDLAARLLRLAAAVAESLEVDAARAERALRDSPAMATDLAEAISLATGLDYRSAYRIVGRALAAGPVDAMALDAAAREVLGRPLDLDPALVAGALDPAAALAARTVPGGAAPEPMDAMLARCRETVDGARGWIDAERSAIEAAERDLVALARALP
ncbi:MAG TPA: lyase family protein [Solirubrobacteraceae bacterium]|nr:lyase family protein [Solirubrobacteraceae bacterium]